MTPTKHPKRRFLRHYVEMVVVMFGGMVVLGAPAGWLFSTLGTSWSRLSPALMLFAMAVTMTAPMIAWMRFRGHGWRPTNEMSAAMLVPAFVAMAMVGVGVTGGTGVLMVFEHVAMLAAMLVAMLLRRDEYGGAGHAHAAAA
jgi:hypothetical protein